MGKSTRVKKSKKSVKTADRKIDIASLPQETTMFDQLIKEYRDKNILRARITMVNDIQLNINVNDIYFLQNYIDPECISLNIDDNEITCNLHDGFRLAKCDKMSFEGYESRLINRYNSLYKDKIPYDKYVAAVVTKTLEKADANGIEFYNVEEASVLNHLFKHDNIIEIKGLNGSPSSLIIIHTDYIVTIESIELDMAVTNDIILEILRKHYAAKNES